MRNLEECKAEVFRRSNERMKARKKMRQRTFICCASLCVVLVAGMIFPRLGPVDELWGNGKDGAAGSVAPEYASVRSTEDGSAYKLHYTTVDKENAIRSYDVLAQFFDDKTTMDMITTGTVIPDSELGGNPVGAESDFTTQDEFVRDTIKEDFCAEEQAPEYEFIFRIEEGEAAVFRLVGNELTDVTNNREIILTEEQLLTIQTHFGIMEE